MRVIIAISDVHLGHPRSKDGENKDKDFKDFLDFMINRADAGEIEKFVLVGDIFDLWRRDSIVLLLHYQDVLAKLKQLADKVGIYYVVGNHDYHLLELIETKVYDTPKNLLSEHWGIKHVSKKKILTSGGEDYLFLHGHQFEYEIILDDYEKFADWFCLSDDEIGGDMDELWEFVQKLRDFFDPRSYVRKLLKFLRNPPKYLRNRRMLENIREALEDVKERLGEEDPEKFKEKARELSNSEEGNPHVIYGHTHSGFVTSFSGLDLRVANTGCWVKDRCNRDERHDRTYLEIEGVEIRLCSYPTKDVLDHYP